jgi:hypothetical protein
MAESKRPVPTISSTTIVGVCNNFVAADPFRELPTYGSMSYTVPPSPEVTDNQPEGAPSRPLSTGAIRVVNSVLGARVPESAIERDSDGDV